MKVLYVTHYAGFLGANRSLLQVIKLLKQQDVEPLVIVPFEGEFTQYLKNENIEYKIIPTYFCLYIRSVNRFRNLYLRLKGCVGEILNVIITCFYCFSMLRKEKIDIVHSNSSATNVGAYVAFFLHVKHVWHVREFLRLHYNYCFPWSTRLQRVIMRNLADVVVPISQSVKQYLATFIDERKLRLIYNGVECTPMVHTVAKCPVNIAVIGLIHPSKRQFMVVRAVNDLIQRGYSNLHLFIIGNMDSAHSDYYEAMDEYIKDNKLEEVITFTGYIKDVSEILSKMHIGILASENEAFGRVTVEYMLNGLVPIVANSGGSVEIVTHGVDGYVFNDESELAGILYDILKDEASMDRMAKKAYHTAITRFSGKQNAVNIYNCYKEILQPHGTQ